MERTGDRAVSANSADSLCAGPGAFKIDYALSQPVPWKAPECQRAITVHLGGTFDEIAAAEDAVARGRCAEKPFVLAAQPSLYDSTRAPEGKHVLWAYCHVPKGRTVDMTERIEAQIERFAPGFRGLRAGAAGCSSPAALEAMDANLVGGDISGGAMTVRQFVFRPGRAICDGNAGIVFVFVVDPAGRRSAWDVRRSRGAAGAAGSGIGRVVAAFQGADRRGTNGWCKLKQDPMGRLSRAGSTVSGRGSAW